MRAKRFSILVTALALVAFFASMSLAATSAELVAQADELYKQRTDMAKARQALELYEQAFKADPNNDVAAARIARAAYWIGKHLEEDDDKVAMFQRGVNACKAALKAKPDSLHATFWLGVSYGVYGQAKGITDSLGLVDPTKELMHKILAKDPSYAGGGAYRVLGRLYFKLPGLFGGDNDKSIEYLEKAVKLGPQRWLNHLYLAETYLDEDEEKKAKALLEAIVAGKPIPGMEPEFEAIKAQAQKLLKEEF